MLDLACSEEVTAVGDGSTERFFAKGEVGVNCDGFEYEHQLPEGCGICLPWLLCVVGTHRLQSCKQ